MSLSIFPKLWKTAAMAATSYVGENFLFLFDYLLRFLRVAVLLALWRMILAGKGTPSGMTLESVLTYTLIGEVFAEQLTSRTELAWSLKDGSILMRFLQPMGLVGQYGAEMCGRWLIAFGLFSLPLLIVSPRLGVNPWPVSAGAAGLFVISLALAIAIGLALEFIFGALMVFFEQNVYAVDRLRVAISTLLSGALLPLALFPWGIGQVFAWLPFASMASAPLRIYTGTGDPVVLLAVQAAWSLVLWPLANWLWRVNREKLVSFGG